MAMLYGLALSLISRVILGSNVPSVQKHSIVCAVYVYIRERNSSSASDAPAMESSLLAAHQSSDGPVQHHNAVMWGYALTHGETKRPSALNDLKLRPRLKLPNSTDKKKWKSLDEEI